MIRKTPVSHPSTDSKRFEGVLYKSVIMGIKSNQVLPPMQCFVYRSLKKNGLYIYLSQQDDFEKIPDAVKNKIGELEFALEFELHEDRKLAKEDASTVIENIKNNGFHIQMPKDIEGLLAEISAGLK